MNIFYTVPKGGDAKKWIITIDDDYWSGSKSNPAPAPKPADPWYTSVRKPVPAPFWKPAHPPAQVWKPSPAQVPWDQVQHQANTWVQQQPQPWDIQMLQSVAQPWQQPWKPAPRPWKPVPKPWTPAAR